MSGTLRVEASLPTEAIRAIARDEAFRLWEELGTLSEFVTPAEAAELISCTRQRIYDLISAGRLSRYKEGGRTLVLRAEVLALVVLDRQASR